MDLALTFQDVVAAELLQKLSFAIAAGSRAALITSRQEESDLQVGLMLGLTKPTTGSITLLGEDVGAASEDGLNALRREVAVVFPRGGLVSNLKVWENLVLPLEYHSSYTPQEIEEKGVAALHRVGYAGPLMALTWHLSLYQKRQIGLARAMLMEPRLIIYNEILAGLNSEEKDAIVAVAAAFHREQPERTSVFMTPNEETILGVPLDSRTYQRELVA